MPQTLTAAIAALQTKAAGLSGMKACPANPPESASQFPFAVSYARTGTETPQSSGWSIGLHTLVCEIHCSRVVLGPAVAQALPYYELMRSAILSDPTLAGTVATVNQLRYEFGRMEYGDVPTIGYKLEVDVKLHGSY